MKRLTRTPNANPIDQMTRYLKQTFFGDESCVDLVLRKLTQHLSALVAKTPWPLRAVVFRDACLVVSREAGPGEQIFAFDEFYSV